MVACIDENLMNNAAETDWMQCTMKMLPVLGSCGFKFERGIPIVVRSGDVAMKMITMAGASALALSILSGGFAAAQAPVLPQTSPSEQMVNEANRSLRNLEIRQQQENRLQFEINSLRAQQLQQQQFPRITGPTAGQNCFPGATGC
jgi:hypothetical protein